jgi:hypothetical protein
MDDEDDWQFADSDDNDPIVYRTILNGSEENKVMLLEWIKGSTFPDYSFMKEDIQLIKLRYTEVLLDDWNLLDHDVRTESAV